MRAIKDQNMSDNKVSYCCHICGETALEIVPGYEMFSQVTSDCKPWPAGNRLSVCQSCGCVQKLIDQKWQADAEKIYKDYSIYYQGGGIEQAVFDRDSGLASSRSMRLLKCLKSNVKMSESGRLLDIGCGNGGLLRAFVQLFPKWSIAGTEYDSRHREAIENITADSTFYTCPAENIHENFDLITMLHILEHCLDPVDFLKRLKDRLKDDGLLVVDVPDYRQNPFDLFVADHCTHFTLSTLEDVLKKSGFSIVKSASDWIPKEISIVASKYIGRTNKVETHRDSGRYSPFETVGRCLKWIEALRQAAGEASVLGRFGIFGTSIAATWLFSEIGEVAGFFVDEDPSRVGKIYMGRPVYHPSDIPSGSNVFLSLPSKIASNVLQRLGRPDVKFHLPPLLKI